MGISKNSKFIKLKAKKFDLEKLGSKKRIKTFGDIIGELKVNTIHSLSSIGKIPLNVIELEHIIKTCIQVCKMNFCQLNKILSPAIKTKQTKTFIEGSFVFLLAFRFVLLEIEMAHYPKLTEIFIQNNEIRKTMAIFLIIRFRAEEVEWQRVLLDVQHKWNVSFKILEFFELKSSVLLSYFFDGKAKQDKDELFQVYLSINERINFKIETLLILMSSAKELISESNQFTNVLVKQFHKENFRNFAHLDSPFKLIKRLAKDKTS